VDSRAAQHLERFAQHSHLQQPRQQRVALGAQRAVQAAPPGCCRDLRLTWAAAAAAAVAAAIASGVTCWRPSSCSWIRGCALLPGWRRLLGGVFGCVCCGLRG
jgi:hypothetical protein